MNTLTNMMRDYTRRLVDTALGKHSLDDDTESDNKGIIDYFSEVLNQHYLTKELVCDAIDNIIKSL